MKKIKGTSVQCVAGALLVAAIPLILAAEEGKRAGKFNATLRLGDVAPTFEALPATDGKSYGSAEFAAVRVVVVAFTCNSCPYAVDYEDRLNAFYEKYCLAYESGEPPRVQLVAINANLISADRLDQMRARAEDKGFQFPYLFDESQQVPQRFGAVRTPEFFVLDEQRRIVYMGAFDDNANPREVQQRYVESAVESTLRGDPIQIGETPPVGCMIRFKRARR